MRSWCAAALWVGAATMAFGGCEPNMRAARQQASIEFGCAKSAVQIRRRSRDTYVATGCDRTGLYQCPDAPGVTQRFCVNLALMARQRGEREFRCELEQVTVDELSPFIFRVAGCDQEAVYHCEASDGRPRCLAERSEGRSGPATVVGNSTGGTSSDDPATDPTSGEPAIDTAD